MGPGSQARLANCQHGNDLFEQSKAVYSDLLWLQRERYTDRTQSCPVSAHTPLPFPLVCPGSPKQLRVTLGGENCPGVDVEQKDYTCAINLVILVC